VTAPTLSQTQLNRATLARQMLLERCSVGVVDVVRRLAGMQAQEPRHPFVGLWTRVEGFSGDQLLSALRSREVVRATLMRSTLHLMGAGDYAALRMSLQPRQAVALRVLGARSEGLDLEAVLPAARELLRGQPMAFDDIRARLAEASPASTTARSATRCARSSRSSWCPARRTAGAFPAWPSSRWPASGSASRSPARTRGRSCGATSPPSARRARRTRSPGRAPVS